MHFPVYSQQKLTNKNKHVLTIDYGYKLDTKWWKDKAKEIGFNTSKATNDSYFKYELILKNNIGIGLDFAVIDIEDEKGFWGFESYTYLAKGVRILPVINYHFLNSPRFDLSVNVSTGLWFLKTKVIHSYPDPNPLNTLGFPPGRVSDVSSKSKRTGLDFCAGVAMRYYISKNFGLFGETGINKSVFQVGFLLGFSKIKF